MRLAVRAQRWWLKILFHQEDLMYYRVNRVLSNMSSPKRNKKVRGWVKKSLLDVYQKLVNGWTPRTIV